MGHLNTAHGDHDACVSFFIIRTDLGEPRITFHRHKKTGKLAMFGGHVELDESPIATLRRELTEESGYRPDQVWILQPRRRLRVVEGLALHPIPAVSTTGQFPVSPDHFHTDLLYALVTSEEPAGELAAGESEDIRLLTTEEVRAIPDAETHPAWKQIALYLLTDMIPDRDTFEVVPLDTFD
ncbi:NUDIX domain-containing protein [Microbacterium sp. 77mftsu3.1]|uniref:NUDIX domain-containing protein n=1 Tax=Microbacterium sp. 77mftsu3.1 TaxID=1761802 RepID=UPI00036C6650|nr:NUDIX domain-containing protein [Microbacterium sp. 77mftsu3.1]SDH48544.1 ADP-ribose pyrophosphatase YjhB, NUDIX family [Microbacterium sp. 77mftsu3.1]